ncbi:MAG: hypothetical protein JW751_20090 [Polyangiaceae bacterium]|nr:hypothetical protein [Polyangiaceae bacterium]
MRRVALDAIPAALLVEPRAVWAPTPGSPLVGQTKAVAAGHERPGLPVKHWLQRRRKLGRLRAIGDASAMTCVSMVDPSGVRLRGEVDLVAGSTIGSALSRAERDGFVSVVVPPPGPHRRGQLGMVIEEAIEEVLAKRGAAPPGVGSASRIDATVGDQLYRARLIGAPGIALAFPALDGLTNLAGALDAEDSAILRWWVTAARERPVRMFFAERDRRIGVYGAPMELGCILAASASPGATTTEPVPVPSPALATSLAAMELSPPPPLVTPSRPDAGRASAPVPTSTRTPGASDRASPSVRPPSGNTVGDTRPEGGLRRVATAPMAVLDLHLDDLALGHDGGAPELPPTKTIAGPPRRDNRSPSTAPARSHSNPPARPSPVATSRTEPNTRSLPDAGEASTGGRSPAPLIADATTRWPTWADELDAARGPKPLSVVERMFTASYVPLRDAIGFGITDERARSVADGWAASFGKSYGDAFESLRARGKRPSMVLDVPEIAQRLGRLHGAKSVQLILVDGMRFDLGLRMHERLCVALDRRAALTERLLLWTALPSTTDIQIDLVGRGPEGLKESRHSPESALPVARGRAAATARRVKAGHRDLLKLDVVAARLAEGTPLAPLEIDRLASAVAESLDHCLGRLPARTLALVFGDHGFTLDADGRPFEGGATPDEVLVPAFAWLVGDVH